MTIVWNPERMMTGKAEIDAEHQEWIRRFNEFEAAVLDAHRLESIQSILNFMVAYSNTHFAHEELLTEGLHTPAAEMNRAEHRQFRQKISDLQRYIAENSFSTVEVVALKIDLEEWLVHHMCEVDTHLWRD